jgi:hypothetical protein
MYYLSCMIPSNIFLASNRGAVITVVTPKQSVLKMFIMVPEAWQNCVAARDFAPCVSDRHKHASKTFSNVGIKRRFITIVCGKYF